MQHVETRDLGSIPKWLHFSLSWLSLASPAWGQCEQWPVTNPECGRVAVCVAVCSEARGHLGRVRFPFSGAGPRGLCCHPDSWQFQSIPWTSARSSLFSPASAPRSSPPLPGLPLSRLGLSRRPQVGWVPIVL